MQIIGEQCIVFKNKIFPITLTFSFCKQIFNSRPYIAYIKKIKVNSTILRNSRRNSTDDNITIPLYLWSILNCLKSISFVTYFKFYFTIHFAFCKLH